MPDLVVPDSRARWPIVAGIAAIACVLAVVAWARSPDRPPDGLLGEDQVPSLFGYDATSARELLTGRGLEVVERASPSCEPEGLVVGSDPLLGAHVDAGDTVTIMTATPLGFSCHETYTNRSDAWEFLAFASRARSGSPVRSAGRRAGGRERARRSAPGPGAATRPAGATHRCSPPVADAISKVYDVPGSACVPHPDTGRLPGPAAGTQVRRASASRDRRSRGAVDPDLRAQRRALPVPPHRRPLPHRRRDRHGRPLHAEDPALTAVVPWTADGSGHGLPGVRRGAQDVAGPCRRAARRRRSGRAPVVRQTLVRRRRRSSDEAIPTPGSTRRWSEPPAWSRRGYPSAMTPASASAALLRRWARPSGRWRCSRSMPT